MIRQLRTITKLLEGAMWLYLPIVMIYWSLTLIKLNAIAPLQAFVGVVVQPLTTIIDKYFDLQFTFNGDEVDYTPLVLIIIITVLAFMLILTSKTLDFVDEKLEKAKIEILKHKEKKAREKQKELELQELERHKVLYVMLRLDQIRKHESYLVNSDEDPFSRGLIDSYKSTIINMATNFSGKEYREYETSPDTSSFLFTDTERFLLYLRFLNNKIAEINKGIEDDLNTHFSYSIACNCSYDTSTAKTDLQLVEKILNLVGKEEIFITSTLKQKLENLNTDIDMKFDAKGLYILDEINFDIYKVKVD